MWLLWGAASGTVAGICLYLRVVLEEEKSQVSFLKSAGDIEAFFEEADTDHNGELDKKVVVLRCCCSHC